MKKGELLQHDKPVSFRELRFKFCCGIYKNLCLSCNSVENAWECQCLTIKKYSLMRTFTSSPHPIVDLNFYIQYIISSATMPFVIYVMQPVFKNVSSTGEVYIK